VPEQGEQTSLQQETFKARLEELELLEKGMKVFKPLPLAKHSS